MKTLRECKYSAFISYAHQDNTFLNGWITEFVDELNRGITSAPALRGVKIDIPKLYFDVQTGSVGGILSEKLKSAIAESFSMIIIVYGNYAQSAWCLKELEYFKEKFGNDGFFNRLYIIALSQEWINYVERNEIWKRLFPYADQIWIPFFKDDDTRAPIDVYMAKERVSPEFKTPFGKLRDDLVSKIKEDIAKSEHTESAPQPEPASLQYVFTPNLENPVRYGPNNNVDPVRIFIESNIREQEKDLWKSLGEQIKKRWNKIVAGMRLAPPLYITARALPVDLIDQHPRLDNADGVVLFWGEKDPASLISQIEQVELKLPARDLAPAIVAYLMPPQPNPNQRIPAWSWKVLRFNNPPNQQNIDVVQDEEVELEEFLREILDRTRKRRLSAANPLAVSPTP